MNIVAMEADNNKFYHNTDTAKGMRYQAWLKNLRSDVYIKQTAQVVSDMIDANKNMNSSAVK